MFFPGIFRLPADNRSSPADPLESSLIEERVESLSPSSNSKIGPATVARLGGVGISKELQTATATLESLERSSMSFAPLSTGPTIWEREMFSINAALVRMEAELEACEMLEGTCEEDREFEELKTSKTIHEKGSH